MIGCIVQARMGSSRLPGKTLMKVDDKNTILDFIINQLSYSKLIDKLILATTNLSMDDIIEDSIKDLDVKLFRGNTNDVLDRYYQCAKKFSLNIIVRITADNPLIDPFIIDEMISKFCLKNYDYMTNTIPRTFPYGTEVEILTFNALEKAWYNAKKPSEREHVTPYFYNNPKNFKIHQVQFSSNLSNLRWTIDKQSDLDLVKLIVSKVIKRPILLDDIIMLYNNEPKIFEINKTHIPNEGYLKSLKEDNIFEKNEKNNEK